MEREKESERAERERELVPLPPAKRLKLAPVVPAAAAGGGQVPSPRWRRLRQTLLVVLFLVRARTTVTTSISQLGRMLQRYVDSALNKYHEVISSKLESFQEQIQGLRHEVAQLSRLCSNHHADQQTRLEANQERIAANGSNTNMRLCFLNGLEPPVYTDENLTSQNHAAIKLAMFEGDKVVESGALSKAKIEILVLRGDFSNKCQDNWTEDEFDKHIMQSRDGHDLVLGTVWLTNGIVELSQIRFREGSCRKNVIMAARVCKSIKTSSRVQEAIMKPVKVLDRRNKSNEKRHPPRLDDELYRLEEIAKDGTYHKRLQEAQIHEVEGFLKALNENPNKLRAILKMENQQNAWLKLTEHARECVLKDWQELKGYHSKEGNVVLFFNYVHELVGAAFPQEYVACQRFNTAQKALVNKWRGHAYEKLKDISPDFVMKGNIPEPISSSSSTDVAPSVLAMGASQQVFSADQLTPYEGTGTAENLPQGADPDYLNTLYCQDQGIPPHGQQQVFPPWCPIDLAGMDFDLYQGASTSAQAQLMFGPCNATQPESTSLAAAPPWMDFDLYQGASTSAQAQLMFGPRNATQPESTSPAAAPPWMSPMAEQGQGPSYSGFP